MSFKYYMTHTASHEVWPRLSANVLCIDLVVDGKHASMIQDIPFCPHTTYLACSRSILRDLNCVSIVVILVTCAGMSCSVYLESAKYLIIILGTLVYTT